MVAAVVVVAGIWATVIWASLAILWPSIRRWRYKRAHCKGNRSNGRGCYMCGGEYTRLRKRGNAWLCRDRELCQETCRLRGLLESMP